MGSNEWRSFMSKVSLSVPELGQRLGEVWQIHARNCAYTASLTPPVSSVSCRLRDPRWCILITSGGYDGATSVVRGEFTSYFPTVDLLWEQFVVAMSEPDDAQPRRPHFAEFRSPIYEEYLRERLNSIGVRSRVGTDFQTWKNTYADLAALVSSVERAVSVRGG